MAKFYGKVGFVSQVERDPETSPGVWVEEITEKYYRGDIIRLSKKWHTSESVNDDVDISNEVSIVADPYAMNNLNSIRYVEILGGLWKVTNISVEQPRLVLSIGGVYNG